MLQHEFPELWLVILCPFSPGEFPTHPTPGSPVKALLESPASDQAPALITFLHLSDGSDGPRGNEMTTRTG